MDLRIRKYVLYRIRNKSKDKVILDRLGKIRKELRKDILDGGYSIDMDGQPRGKGGTSDVTQKKALKLIEVDRRIEKLQAELSVFDTVEEKIQKMGDLANDIYNETIVKECTDLTAKAQLLHMGRRQLIQSKARILEMFAKELGEYIDLDEIENDK